MTFYNYLLSSLPNEFTAKIIYYILITIALLLACSIINFLVNRVVLKYITKYIKNNKYKWDDVLLDAKLFQRIALIIPGLLIYMFASFYDNLQDIIQKVAIIYILVIISLVFRSLLAAIDSIYKQNPVSKERPIKGLLQIIEIAVYVVVGIAVISYLIDKNPIYLLSGVGAVTAVVSLIFKDIIIGFVSGIQLVWNDMLRIGDWVEMPKYNTDGDVLDITLYSVKIQNWDKTISTIPTSAFITDSFKNWKGMREYGGRRVKRSFLIDLNTIKICSDEMVERFKKIDFISEYMEEITKEIDNYNKENIINTELHINGKQLTNLRVFRAYLTNYLKNTIELRPSSTTIVRQLAPTENGIPIEIYLFVADTRWVNYETIQADVFDHILAVIDIFELRMFQNPTGNDIKELMKK
ncbi:MAG TPA: mechanosensitive ion channel [Sedimentibacter sp.]|jgi:miniconductance mechanosensitive channel|nr:mechanosensitive ion channel [Sedimentibacter sp.]HQC69667.1 mechanosensitive ion channel [Sedimentibacter sp.]HQK54021.1 mechanosensitive ion channel [Sedimentibacter sp.]HQO71418.1 mechanosensitive ion channel [Sedimentibacter sp.]